MCNLHLMDAVFCSFNYVNFVNHFVCFWLQNEVCRESPIKVAHKDCFFVDFGYVNLKATMDP